MINFLDELGNFKQKRFTLRNVSFFLHFKATDPMMQHFTFEKDTYESAILENIKIESARARALVQRFAVITMCCHIE